VHDAALHVAAYTDASAFGGAERCLATILAGLASDIAVTVVGTSADVVDEVVRERPGARAFVLSPVKTKRDFGPILEHVKAMRRLGADVVHINLRTPYSCQYGLFAALLARGSRVVAVEHLPLHSESATKRWFKRRTSRRLSGHVAVGEGAAREVERDAGLAPGSIAVIRNGVPAQPERAVAEQFGPSPVVGGAGRLDKQKGFDILVDALELLPVVTAVVVGDGPERGVLEARAAQRGVADRFVITGWRPVAAPLLRGFDVFALPSRFEGLPLVVLEAFEAGVPVVATDVGSVAEAVTPGETGLLVPPEDPAALAEDDLRRRLAAAGHEAWRDRFDAKRMVASYEELYRSLAA
jgi:glycosyltransferase involved in cell wall biosynthesis